MKGKFISFEGPDGSGKTTQVRLLVSYLRDKGYPVLQTREPGGTKISEKIRSILLDPENKELSERAEVFLYAAARAQHLEVIKPALAEGKIIVCDRFIDSTIAYQGFGRGLDLNFLERINEIATDMVLPDMTIIIDVASEVGLARIKGNRGEGDRLEQEKYEFHNRVRKGYLKLAQKCPNRIKVVSGEKNIEEVFQIVKGYVQNLLS